MTYASTIKCWLNQEEHFMGCFKASKLPAFPKSFPKSLIINTEENEDVGHFVAVLLQKKYVIFFDSLGYKFLNVNIRLFLRKFYDKVYYYKFPLQHNLSLKCAHFCTIFVLRVKNMKDFQRYLNMFYKSNLQKNDYIIDFLIEMSQCKKLNINKPKNV